MPVVTCFIKSPIFVGTWRYSEIRNTILIPNHQKNFSRSKIFPGQGKTSCQRLTVHAAGIHLTPKVYERLETVANLPEYMMPEIRPDYIGESAL
jgi:hypothetical protein